MKFKKTYTLLVFFCALQLLKLEGQNDVIYTIDGDKINCLITKEEPLTIYFKIGGSISTTEASILREKVKSIEYAPKQKTQNSQPIINPAQVETDDYVPSPQDTSLKKSPYPHKLKKPMNLFSFSIGYSLPVSKFSENKSDTNKIGPARNGYALQLNFTHFINSNFGINVQGFYSQNELNPNPIINRYNKATDSIWHASKSNWEAYGITVGAVIYKEVGDFLFSAKINAGYLSLKYPDLKMSINSSNYFQYQTVSADAIVAGGNMGMSYTVLENLSIIGEISYLQAKCKFNEVLILGEVPGVSFPKKTSQTKRDVIQNYQSVFTTLGLSYRF